MKNGLSKKEIGELYRIHLEWVFNFFRRRGFDDAEAQDLMQETFAEALRSRDKHDGSNDGLPWIMGIARNLYRKELGRRNQKSIDTLADFVNKEEQAQEQSQEDNTLSMETLEQIARCIELLPPQMRNCLKMRVSGTGEALLVLEDPGGAGLRPKDIGLLLGIEPQTVRSHLFAARDKVRRCWEESRLE